MDSLSYDAHAQIAQLCSIVRSLRALGDDDSASINALSSCVYGGAASMQRGKPVVAEVFSRLKFTDFINSNRRLGLSPGYCLDLSTGWNANIPEDRRWALDQLRTQAPALVVCSPRCTPFSALQRLFNKEFMETDEYKKLLKECIYCTCKVLC